MCLTRDDMTSLFTRCSAVTCMWHTNSLQTSHFITLRVDGKASSSTCCKPYEGFDLTEISYVLFWNQTYAEITNHTRIVNTRSFSDSESLRGQSQSLVSSLAVLKSLMLSFEITNHSKSRIGSLEPYLLPLFLLIKLFFFLFAAVSLCHFRWVCVFVSRAPRKIG